MILWLLPDVLSSSSNGHRSLVYMIKQLVQCGYLCGVLVPSLSRFQNLSTLELPDSVAIFAKTETPSHSICVVALDTSDMDMVCTLRQQGHQILWWLMAPPGLLGSPFPNIKEWDSVAIYSSFVLPNQRRYCFVQDPVPFRQILRLGSSQKTLNNSHDGSHRSRLGIYCGKSRLSLLDPRLEDLMRDAILLPFDRYWPKSRSEYCKLIYSLDALICFDPLTSVIMDVAIQGKPVYIPSDPFPTASKAGFPLSSINIVYNNLDRFLKHLGPTNQVKCAMTDDCFRSLEVVNQEGIYNFLCIVTELVKDRSQDKTMRGTKDTIVSLKSHLNILKKLSSIQPCIDGQAASARFLSFYLLVIKMPVMIRKLMGPAMKALLSTSDLLAASDRGRLVLRISLHLPWTLKSIHSRLKWIILGSCGKLLLPSFGRTIVSQRKS
jgi:hypothetical protein